MAYMIKRRNPESDDGYDIVGVCTRKNLQSVKDRLMKEFNNDYLNRMEKEHNEKRKELVNELNFLRNKCEKIVDPKEFRNLSEEARKLCIKTQNKMNQHIFDQMKEIQHKIQNLDYNRPNIIRDFNKLYEFQYVSILK